MFEQDPLDKLLKEKLKVGVAGNRNRESGMRGATLPVSLQAQQCYDLAVAGVFVESLVTAGRTMLGVCEVDHIRIQFEQALGDASQLGVDSEMLKVSEGASEVRSWWIIRRRRIERRIIRRREGGGREEGGEGAEHANRALGSSP